ncbi:MAG: hydrogenase maturation protease [Chloroflexi bacterium]|nr:hydrogenase maturation protease [Chloroflexota bacterium]
MKTLVLGIGNPILQDDGVGPRLIRELRSLVTGADITLEDTSLSGVDLMEILAGFDRAIIIDAIKSGGKPGQVYRLTLNDLGTEPRDAFSEHNMSLFQSIELGKKLKLHMPKDVVIIAVEAENVSDFGETLTPEVEKAIPVAIQRVIDAINSKLPWS